MNRHVLRYIILTLALTCLQAVQAQVLVYPLPEKDGPHTSDLYSVRVRPSSGGDWQSVPVLRCDVNTRRVQQAAFAEFDMGEPVQVQVIRRNAPFHDVRVRPSQRGIAPSIINDSTICFTLQRPESLSVEFDGDRFHNIHIFGNTPLPVVADEPSPDAPDAITWQGVQSQDVFVRNPSLIYFGPGVHRPKDLPSAEIKIPSNCTVYLAPGAVVKARLIVDHVENVRIIGRGIIDHPLRGVEITFSKNVLVDGITVLNPAHYTIFGGQSEDITIRNIKSFSARPWSDGIDLMCCRRVRIDNCFLRTSDDCIALYNHRWWYWGGSEDIDVSRCILWPDVAHPVNIGSHGDDRNPDGETLRHVRIHDCDIIGDDAAGLGLLAINCGDNNHIRDIRFERIRAEGLRRCRPFDLRIFQSEKYNRAPGCCIDSIAFVDFTISPDVPDSCVLPNRVEGMKEHPVGRYTLERVSHTTVTATNL